MIIVQPEKILYGRVRFLRESERDPTSFAKYNDPTRRCVADMCCWLLVFSPYSRTPVMAPDNNNTQNNNYF